MLFAATFEMMVVVLLVLLFVESVASVVVVDVLGRARNSRFEALSSLALMRLL